jgi:hypothetical protein
MAGGGPLGSLRPRGQTDPPEQGGRRRPRRDAKEVTPSWILRPGYLDRVFDMEGLLFETYVAAISKDRPRKQPRSGDGTAVEKKGIDGEVAIKQRSSVWGERRTDASRCA